MNKNGFTLLEVLFTLGVLSILLFISVPISFSTLEKQQIQQFFNTFEFDVLYIQHLSTTSDEFIKIRFYEDHYKVYKGSKEKLAIRNYPDGLQVDRRVNPEISFYVSGIVEKPGTIKVTTNDGTYHIVFPLGKGRCYIVKV